MEFRLDYSMTEAERGFFEGMTRRQQSRRALPARLKRGDEATLEIVSIADLKLLTEGKFYDIDSVFENSDLIIYL